MRHSYDVVWWADPDWWVIVTGWWLPFIIAGLLMWMFGEI